jgi:hypothetical protein
VQNARDLLGRQEIRVQISFDFGQLVTSIKVYAVDTASLIIFLAFLAKYVWREIKPLFHKTVHK